MANSTHGYDVCAIGKKYVDCHGVPLVRVLYKYVISVWRNALMNPKLEKLDFFLAVNPLACLVFSGPFATHTNSSRYFFCGLVRASNNVFMERKTLGDTTLS